MRKIIVVALMLAVAGCQQQQGSKDGAGAAPQTDQQKTFYALGLSLGRQIQVFDMTPEELEYVKAGITAQVTGKEPAVDIQTFGPKLSELARERFQKAIDRRFHREKYNFDQAMGKMRLAIGSLVDRETLGRRLLEAAW